MRKNAKRLGVKSRLGVENHAGELPSLLKTGAGRFETDAGRFFESPGPVQTGAGKPVRFFLHSVRPELHLG